MTEMFKQLASTNVATSNSTSSASGGGVECEVEGADEQSGGGNDGVLPGQDNDAKLPVDAPSLESKLQTSSMPRRGLWSLQEIQKQEELLML